MVCSFVFGAPCQIRRWRGRSTAAAAARHFLEGQLDGFVGRFDRRGCGKARVSPVILRGLDPLRFALMVFIFDHDAHPHVAVLIVGRTEDPNTGTVHLNNDIRTLGDIQFQDLHARRPRNRIAVDRNDGEAVARQRERYVHTRAGIKKPEENALVGADADRLVVIGEIMVRPRVPFAFMAGYHNMPDRTVEAWRNFWFHTGDAGTMDADGYVTFVDRIKDCIRRRGENISSFEVEAAITRLDGVKEVAAFAVPAEMTGGEDEVMLAVVVEDGAALDAPTIARFADEQLPRFAQPRFIEIVDNLPKTPTAKVQKNKLRQRGIPDGVWDRNASR
jgi:acyl-CoA synthetase (AMP-forming)/AMP-acid ligase II